MTDNKLLIKTSNPTSESQINKRGGKRKGSGRKTKYGSQTIVMRVPIDLSSDIQNFINNGNKMKLPLYASKVSAGFPSPADDYIATRLDLNNHIIKNPSATFFVRAVGSSMIKAGIFDGDLLVVDRSLNVTEGRVVIAAIDGELTVKRYCVKDNKPFLMPENDKYPPITINEEQGVYIWGVVTNVIHPL
ncbi:MAG: DNA polymerase V [Rickettsiales bacterium]|jgi:DNA polymerase V|nr:DNA polymerase V [Rickettsiales bacterium]|tara:strand:+ start:3659 stop:4225 length:567 start_codon:yes stop_codon:yes gene_type:complete